MSLLDELKKVNYIENTKGGKYYGTTYNSNLDVFASASRNSKYSNLTLLFKNALEENETLALANLLYLLDIREGKGERRIFTIMFRTLCEEYPDLAKRILPYIGSLGRYDYLLYALKSPIEKETVKLIKEQLKKDMDSSNPSLLAKWLPTHRTHKKNNEIAKYVRHTLGMKEKEYRLMLSTLRRKINIVERNLTEKTYDNIDFSKVPTKAMIKYNKAFIRNMNTAYKEYIQEVKNNKSKINTKGLFCYEVIKKVLIGKTDGELLDLMWKNQKDILKGVDKNVLVVADTSGSMTDDSFIPLASSIGLAIYIAERNTGIFKDNFITFSSRPILQEIKGSSIVDKVRNIKAIVENTDIDKVFELLLNTAKDNNIKESEMPSHIIIISDMEFDQGVMSKKGTNFQGWKKSFEKAGYTLPKIIFWNVNMNTKGYPISKYDKDTVQISGFSPNVLENILDFDKIDPTLTMLKVLERYIKMLERE